jgi:hypothetical protein
MLYGQSPASTTINSSLNQLNSKHHACGVIVTLVQWSDVHIFQKSRCYFKIIGMRRVTWSKLHTDDLWILCVSIWKLPPGICAPLSVVVHEYMETISFTKLRPHGKEVTYVCESLWHALVNHHQMGVYWQECTCISSADIIVLVTVLGNGSP